MNQGESTNRFGDQNWLEESGGLKMLSVLKSHSSPRVHMNVIRLARPGQASMPITRTLAPFWPGRERYLQPALRPHCPRRTGFKTVTTRTNHARIKLLVRIQLSPRPSTRTNFSPRIWVDSGERFDLHGSPLANVGEGNRKLSFVSTAIFRSPAREQIFARAMNLYN